MLFAALPETATVPMGLEYHPDFLAAPEEDGLLARIDSSEWLVDLSRRVMHFGYKYDYTSRRLDETARIGPLPEWLAHLAHMVREAASEEAKQLLDRQRPFEQAIVNEYLPGQGIAPHIDRDCFGPVIATVSLGSAVNMDFCCESTGDEGSTSDEYVQSLGTTQPCSLTRRRSLQVAPRHREAAIRHIEGPKDQASATRVDHVSHHCRSRVAKNSPAMPCGAGHARSTEDRLTDCGASHHGNFFGHPQARVGGGATWVDDAVVWGVGGLGGVWGCR